MVYEDNYNVQMKTALRIVALILCECVMIIDGFAQKVRNVELQHEKHCAFFQLKVTDSILTKIRGKKEERGRFLHVKRS